ncbi:hypothetical protein BDN70DRAFT_548799 [Pholiota conissans]|uniref:CcmS related domain-containing protein n=1 Tax=Pholiota conissans TaxID=109636 RepID=A0A9P5Z798_9AGAR|nr:hypothetical protein BDN70DRAFT_548799 [Pholiota conissans]
MSSASAAAALLESTANRLSQQPRVVSPMNLQVALPGKRTWNYPQPLCANGPVAGPIPVDPSWTTSGGNTWSNKNRQAKIEGHPLDAIFSGRQTWEKIKWGLSENNIDKRPMIMLEWVETWAHTLAMTGLVKFIESRQRGALFINAAYRTFSPTSVSPDLDWRTLDQLRETRDRHLQKYTSEYNPASCVVVFVYLPSSTGRSVAIWLREIAIPEGLNAEYLVRANDIRIKIDGGRG